MFPIPRQLRIAFKILCFQRIRNLPSNSTQVNSVHARAFATSPQTQTSDEPSLKKSSLFQQLTTNPEALLALKDFGRLMTDQGIDFSLDRPPSSLQMFKLLANPEFRKGIQKLRDDLARAGVKVDPESAMKMLNAFKGQDTTKK